MIALDALFQVSATPDTVSIFSGSLAAPVPASAGPESFPEGFQALIGMLRGTIEPLEDVPEGTFDFDAPADLAFSDRALPTNPAPSAAPPAQIAQAIIRRMLNVPRTPAPAVPVALAPQGQVTQDVELIPLPAPDREHEHAEHELPEAAMEALPASPVPTPGPLSLPVPTAAPEVDPQTGMSSPAPIPAVEWRADRPVSPAPLEASESRATPALPLAARRADTQIEKAPLAFGLRLTPEPEPEVVAEAGPSEPSVEQPEIEAQWNEAAPQPKVARPQGEPPKVDPKATPKPEPESEPTPESEAKAVPDTRVKREAPSAEAALAAPPHRATPAHEPSAFSVNAPLTRTDRPAAEAPRDVADVLGALRSSENIALSRPAPASPWAPAQEIAVRVSRPDAGPPVDVHVRQYRGEIQVAVRTVDIELQSNLRTELNTLVDSLEKSGYRTETVTPRESLPTREPSPQRTAATSALDPMPPMAAPAPGASQQFSQQRESGDPPSSSRQHHPQQQQNQQQQQQRRAPWLLWQETLEQTYA